MRRTATLLGVLAMVISACGQATVQDNEPAASQTTSSATATSTDTPSTTVTPPVPPAAAEPFDWSAASINGMTTVASGQTPSPAALPFPAAVPNSAGTPSYVFVSDPAHWPSGESAVLLQYDGSSPYGVLRVTEEKMPPGLVDQSFIQQLASTCQDCTDNRLVSVTPTIQGALMAGQPATSVTFLVGPYKVVVIGPADTFTTDDAVTVAGQVANGLAQSSTAPNQ
jgi:hypothetical protein